MDAASTLRELRERSGLGVRALASAAGTSHATLIAYEQGRKTPGVSTLDRIARSAGFALDVELHQRQTGIDRAEELVAVLDLAGEFPARHPDHLDAPVFGR